MIKRFDVIVLMILFLSIFNCSFGASFQCNSDRLNTIEQAICDTPSLSKADEELAVLYKEAKSKSGSEIKQFQRVARSLLADRNKCVKIECLEEWYEIAKETYSEIIKQGPKYYSSQSSPIQQSIEEINSRTYFYTSNLEGRYSLERLCNENNNAEACHALGVANILHNAAKVVNDREPHRDQNISAIIYLKKACQANWPNSCDILNKYFDGDIESINRKSYLQDINISFKMPNTDTKKLELFSYGCDLGFKMACVEETKLKDLLDKQKKEQEVRKQEESKELKGIKLLGFEINKTKKSEFLKKVKIVKQKEFPFIYDENSLFFTTNDYEKDIETIKKEHGPYLQDRLQMKALIGVSAIFDKNDILKTLVLEISSEDMRETAEIIGMFYEHLKNTYRVKFKDEHILLKLWTRFGIAGNNSVFRSQVGYDNYMEFLAKDNVRVAIGTLHLGKLLEEGIIMITAEDVISNMEQAVINQEKKKNELIQKDIQEKRDNVRSIFGE